MRLRNWWTLSRPRLLPSVLGLVVFGYGFAHWDQALTGRGAGTLAAILVAWTLLHAGTLWMNAALDQDEEDVLLGVPCEVPSAAWPVGAIAVGGSVAIAGLAGPSFAMLAGLAAILSMLYSHPDTAWKGHPVGGPFVNLVGYGMLSPLAGWWATGTGVSLRGMWVGLGLVAGVGGAYFLAQAFQESEDRRRGYRTLVATHGASGALSAARLCLLLSLNLATALVLIGWLPWGCAIATPLSIWVDRWLVSWRRALPVPDGVQRVHEAARRLAWSVALVGLAVLGHYVADSAAGGPVAGLATPSVRADRAVQPPAIVRRMLRMHEPG